MPKTSLRRVTLSGRLQPLKEGENVVPILIKCMIYMFLDIVIVLTVSVLVFYWFVKTAVAPFENDFPCSDEAIRQPFYPNTVGLKHLLFVSLGSPFFLIVLVEALVFKHSEGPHRISKFFTTSTLLYLKYLLLYALCTFSMEFLKCYFGRLRPHFVSVCQPDWSSMDCSTDPNSIIPASQIKCLNENLHKVRTARTSFPSGHTAAAVFVWLFYFIYLTRLASATKLSSIVKIRNIVLPIITIWTVVTAVTRVTDCWHHPTDVLGGFFLALFTLVPFYWNSWKTSADVYIPRRIQALKSD